MARKSYAGMRKCLRRWRTRHSGPLQQRIQSFKQRETSNFDAVEDMRMKLNIRMVKVIFQRWAALTRELLPQTKARLARVLGMMQVRADRTAEGGAPLMQTKRSARHRRPNLGM